MKQQNYKKIYDLLIEGLPAKKICTIIGRDKSQISRIISAFEKAGFIVCINAGDRVKFYEATKKIFTDKDYVILSTYLQEKPKKKSYGGYETRVHGISFKADVLIWKKKVKWDHVWSTNNTNHFMLRKNDATFIRHKSKKHDTLVIVIPDLLWNINQKKSISKAVFHKARLFAGDFSSQYGIKLRNFVECGGTSYAIPVRHPDLVQLAQRKTVYFDNKAMLDASHGVPEFEAPLNVMQDLLSLPGRVSKLEHEMGIVLSMIEKISKDMIYLNSGINALSKDIKELNDMFSRPSKPPSDKDTDWG